MPRDVAAPREDTHGKNTLEAVADTVTQAVRVGTEGASSGSGISTQRHHREQRPGWILLGRADSPYESKAEEDWNPAGRRMQASSGSATEAASAVSDTVKTQAAQSSRTLQRRGKQMAITAQTKAEGLQEAAADAVASAAGRFGAMVPKEGQEALVGTSQQPTSALPHEDTHAKNSLESAADTVVKALQVGSQEAAARSHEVAVAQRRQMKPVPQPGYILLGRPDSPYDDQLEAITSTAKQAASSIQDTADNVRTAAGRTGSQAAQSLHTLSSRAGVETEQTTSAAQDSATDVITSAASRLGAIVPQESEDDASIGALAASLSEPSSRHQESRDWVNDVTARSKRGIWTWLYGDPDYPHSHPAQHQLHSREYASGQIPSNTEDLVR